MSDFEAMWQRTPLSRYSLTYVILVVAAIVMFITLTYCLDISPPRDDVINFFNHAEAMKDGLLPYKDFEFEFPPFSLLFFLIPGLFTSDLNTYAALFGLEVTLFLLIALFYMLRICERLKINRVLVTVVFLVLTMIYFTDMIKKFDVIPMALTVVSLYYFTERRLTLAYGIMMFAALVKIYPILLICVFFVINCLESVSSRRKNILEGVVVCIVVGLVAVLPLMALSVPFSDIMSFVTFHTDRGFQVESVMGAIIQALGLLGFTTFELDGVHYTWDVIGPMSDAILPYWNAVYVASILLVLALMAVHVHRNKEGGGYGWNPRILLVMAATVIITFMLTNKVFSTQYMIWIFPFLAILPFYFKGNAGAVALAVVSIVTELCARGILYFEPAEPWFVFYNLVRDALLIIMLFIMIRGLIGAGGVVTRYFDLKGDDC